MFGILLVLIFAVIVMVSVFQKDTYILDENQVKIAGLERLPNATRNDFADDEDFKVPKLKEYLPIVFQNTNFVVSTEEGAFPGCEKLELVLKFLKLNNEEVVLKMSQA